MPAKPSWLLHIPRILDELQALPVPVIDRATCENLFRLGRRRSIELIHRFGGYRSGNVLLVDRLELIAGLEDLWESPDSVRERRRKSRLVERLESLRRYRKAASVVIPVPASTCKTSPQCLPAGIEVSAGKLTLQFTRAEELLQRLYELSQTAAGDYETFRETVEQGAQSC
jgi:hypothetical protein